MNKQLSIQYEDTWAAPGSKLHTALTEGKIARAEKIYRECEDDLKRLEGRENKDRWTAEQASAFYGIPLRELT